MKICKRIAGLLLAVLTLALLLPTSAMAAGSIDTAKAVSLTITNVSGDVKLKDVEFRLYQVSTVDECGELTVLPAFSAYAAELDIRGKNADAWLEITQKLESDILAGNISSAQSITIRTNDAGVASSASLEQGLYLVLGTTTVSGDYVYTTAPFMVMLPWQDTEANIWVYDVAVSTKVSVSPVLVDYTVVKQWDDKGYESQRPRTIEITLLCDGKKYETITLPEDGKWFHTWSDLEANHKWTVKEAKVSGYLDPKITVSEDGHTFTVKNTYDTPKTPEKPKLPQTGQLWWPVVMLMAAGLLFVVIGLVRRRGETDEA